MEAPVITTTFPEILALLEFIFEIFRFLCALCGGLCVLCGKKLLTAKGVQV
jgi:hypothetical protein